MPRTADCSSRFHTLVALWSGWVAVGSGDSDTCFAKQRNYGPLRQAA